MKRILSIALVIGFILSAFQAEAHDRYRDHRHHNRSADIVAGAIIGTALGVAISQPNSSYYPRHSYAPQRYNEMDSAYVDGYERARARYEDEQYYKRECARRDAIRRAQEQGERDFYRDRYRW